MVTIKGKPAAMVKSGTKTDFLTPEEFAEDVYGKPVAYGHFGKAGLPWEK